MLVLQQLIVYVQNEAATLITHKNGQNSPRDLRFGI